MERTHFGALMNESVVFSLQGVTKRREKKNLEQKYQELHPGKSALAKAEGGKVGKLA